MPPASLARRYATIAYSGQQPWMTNGSIRDNILFGESYRPKRYEKIIETCALKSDIDTMPNGDLTQVGERGLNLSGGQKMRVSLARAFYSSANVVILVCCSTIFKLNSQQTIHRTMRFLRWIMKWLPQYSRSASKRCWQSTSELSFSSPRKLN